MPELLISRQQQPTPRCDEADILSTATQLIHSSARDACMCSPSQAAQHEPTPRLCPTSTRHAVSQAAAQHDMQRPRMHSSVETDALGPWLGAAWEGLERIGVPVNEVALRRDHALKFVCSATAPLAMRQHWHQACIARHACPPSQGQITKRFQVVWSKLWQVVTQNSNQHGIDVPPVACTAQILSVGPDTSVLSSSASLRRPGLCAGPCARRAHPGGS